MSRSQQALVALASAFLIIQSTDGTERPIIGILCHEIDDKPPECYIAASYVKAVEASGARVVPILLSNNEDYYTKMVDNVNGILFPGGGVKESTVGGYFEAARYIFNYTRKIQAKGDHFPLLGVCLGMEILAELSNEDYMGNRTLDKCPGLDGVMLPLKMTADYKNSSLYGNAPQQIINILTTQNVTANYHSFCVRPANRLKLPWHVLSLNQDSDGNDFISSMELDGPIVGIQFHPEKNAWEWQKKHPSFEDGLLSSRYFYDWLVTEARKNSHSFASSKDEETALIYNYCPRYTGLENSSFTQKYYLGESFGRVLLPSNALVVFVLFLSLMNITRK